MAGSHDAPSTRVRVFGKRATLIKRGPEQSIIKWDDPEFGNQTIVPNSWIKEERKQ